ncbi:O-succinylhomoserine sulfhydrylase [Limnobacter sp.]|uniref:O-succinylhomoserine sulfhydrylase n=1 Tax=Limnobacter sp. TaxID=2003368 RepID=UPI0025C022FF|nr:O-succinylhomoserine sulfhydrylase [Limnobacter sp.]
MSNNKPKANPADWATATKAIRAGSHRTEFGEHSEAMFLTSSFVFDNAAQAAARFAGTEEGNVYARFTNPSVQMFEQRLAVLEDMEYCLATSSGMAAITTTCMGLLNAGDHIIASKALFGATVQLFVNILSRFGIETTFVDGTSMEAWEKAIKPNTKLFYSETPSNPLTEILDMRALSDLAKKHGIYNVVDNCFCTPALQKPVDFGTEIIIHSATKYLDGQGRVLGGAICGPKDLLKDKILPVLRTAGPTLSAFNAWVLFKGLETLNIRMLAQSAAALEIAGWLEAHPAVSKVYYPGLESHPQHALAMKQQKTGGAIVSFEVKASNEDDARAKAWHVIDSSQLMSITANLGDTRTTITHPGTTTHGRLSPEAREAAGIKQGLIRLAIGLEDMADLKKDLLRGLGG